MTSRTTSSSFLGGEVIEKQKIRIKCLSRYYTEFFLLMALAIVAEPAPLKMADDGVVRVGDTRVTLDTVVSVFKQGVTAEEIVYRYPSLQLADVYATVAFYLNHQQEVETYLQQRQQKAQEVRKMNETRFDPQGLRDRLLARQAEREVC